MRTQLLSAGALASQPPMRPVARVLGSRKGRRGGRAPPLHSLRAFQDPLVEAPQQQGAGRRGARRVLQPPRPSFTPAKINCLNGGLVHDGCTAALRPPGGGAVIALGPAPPGHMTVQPLHWALPSCWSRSRSCRRRSRVDVPPSSCSFRVGWSQMGHTRLACTRWGARWGSGTQGMDQQRSWAEGKQRMPWNGKGTSHIPLISLLDGLLR